MAKARDTAETNGNMNVIMISNVDMVSSIIGSKYENRVQMPGRTYDSNADTLVEGLCVWQVRPARFLGNDFDMFVAARQVNIWAWAVALAVLVLALGVWLVPLKKGGRGE